MADNERGFNLIIEGDDADIFAGAEADIDVPDDAELDEPTELDEEADEGQAAEAEGKAKPDADDDIEPDLPVWAVKRIKKEKFKKHEAERQAEAEAARAAQLEQELAHYRAQAAHQENQQTLAQLEAERKEVFQQIREARDSFEDDAEERELALQERLAEINLDIVHAKRGQVAPRQQTQQPPPQASADAKPEVILAQQWISQNPQYNQNTQFKQAVDTLYDTLIQEGFRADHPRLFQELNSRLHTVKPYTGATGAPSRGNEGGNGKSTSDGWDADVDPIVMRRMGKDPNNAKQRAQYLADQRRFGGTRFK